MIATLAVHFRNPWWLAAALIAVPAILLAAKSLRTLGSVRRAAAPGAISSLQSMRISADSSPNAASARAFAASVLPTPEGPLNSMLSTGRPGSEMAAAASARASTSASTAMRRGSSPWSIPVGRSPG